MCRCFLNVWGLLEKIKVTDMQIKAAWLCRYIPMTEVCVYVYVCVVWSVKYFPLQSWTTKTHFKVGPPSLARLIDLHCTKKRDLRLRKCWPAAPHSSKWAWISFHLFTFSCVESSSNRRGNMTRSQPSGKKTVTTETTKKSFHLLAGFYHHILTRMSQKDTIRFKWATRRD